MNRVNRRQSLISSYDVIFYFYLAGDYRITEDCLENYLVDSILKIVDNRSKAIQVIETLLKISKQSLENGEDVLISGFGKFCVKEKHERRGRNPLTGKDLMLNARRVVTFRSSGILNRKLNGRGD